MITIIGMHRSGTSALAGAMHKLGADLGPESTWISPASDNPRGFFEYRPVLDLNREILAALGGVWSAPPALPAGWIDDERLNELRTRAEDIAGGMSESMVVKDPRLSLVQPLWEQVTSVPKSILCVRHPSAVAGSLEARNGFSIERGLFLWFRYTAAAMLNRPEALVVHYETLLSDPIETLRRIAEHIELNVTQSIVDGASESLFQSMSHHEDSTLPDTPIGTICGRLYHLLEGLASDLDADDVIALWARLVSELPWGGPGDRDINRVRHELTERDAEIKRLGAENARLQERSRRLELELVRAGSVVDIASITETYDLLRSQEGEVR